MLSASSPYYKVSGVTYRWDAGGGGVRRGKLGLQWKVGEVSDKGGSAPISAQIKEGFLMTIDRG